ncbi:hypothetical protein HPB50_007944 [Hyalomma asiaticum]|uniref:Uncharacterized protein n=1 Tax=Hyalomma asiaticum TaxID=266040 RepID=A0ACB7S8B3_HYAAI|nr:hypothetical protein HPB50_007944 [Hyalomma asiaticum]
METYVLIPKELSLVIGDRAASSTTTDSTTTSGDRPSTKEVTAAVWSNSRISRGTRFLPFQGTVRLDKLEVFGTLDQKDGGGDATPRFDDDAFRHLCSSFFQKRVLAWFRMSERQSFDSDDSLSRRRRGRRRRVTRVLARQLCDSEKGVGNGREEQPPMQMSRLLG